MSEDRRCYLRISPSGLAGVVRAHAAGDVAAVLEKFEAKARVVDGSSATQDRCLRPERDHAGGLARLDRAPYLAPSLVAMARTDRPFAFSLAILAITLASVRGAPSPSRLSALKEFGIRCEALLPGFSELRPTERVHPNELPSDKKFPVLGRNKDCQPAVYATQRVHLNRAHCSVRSAAVRHSPSFPPPRF